MRSRSSSARRSTSAFLRAVKSVNSLMLAMRPMASAESSRPSFDESLDRRRDLKGNGCRSVSDVLIRRVCPYLLGFFSPRSGERDLCRCDELATLRSFDLSRSRDNLRCLCFLLDGLRDRPIVLECNTKSKREHKQLAISFASNESLQKNTNKEKK